VLPEPPKPETGFVVPSHFPAPSYDFASNPLDEKKFQLGRMLFYDPILSKDSCISCSVCHQQSRTFADLGTHQFSHGVAGQPGSRNTPGIVNMAWSPTFMWDGGLVNLEMQALAPINNPVEMAESLANVLRKLNRHPLYRPRFKEAFEKDSIDSQQMLKALAQFTVRIVSATSRYDEHAQGTNPLTGDQLNGLLLFKEKCSACHSGELFTDYQFRNIGLDSTSLIVSDLGRELVTGLISDRRKFKTPSLRNVAVTGPYFHDGRVSDLKNAILTHGQQNAPNRDPFVDDTTFKLSSDEVDKIYQFLTTLTDTKMMVDPNLAIHASDYAPYSIVPVVPCLHVH